jgi:hypothetical protein
LVLLPFDLRRQNLIPALVAVLVAGPKLVRQTITLAFEQQRKATI